MFELHSLIPTLGSKKRKKRLGRGTSSGKGKTCGKGHKGQNARKSGGVKPGFEGGQTAFYKRIPKIGLRYHQRKNQYFCINLRKLKKISEQEITPKILKKYNLLPTKENDYFIKIIGNKGVNKIINLKVHCISAGAKKTILKFGGSVKLIAINKHEFLKETAN
jgi:large subunit ribosomal protein L15